MPALTADMLEKILDDKLRPLSEQLKQALESISTLHTKYDNIKEISSNLNRILVQKISLILWAHFIFNLKFCSQQE